MQFFFLGVRGTTFLPTKQQTNMAPNLELVRDYSTFGDLTQRDLLHRNKTQVFKNGAVENYFYHIDSSNDKVETAVEKISFDTESAVSKYELFTKPADSSLSTAAEASMLEITTANTVCRSIMFNANNVSVGGNIGVTGDAALGNTSVQGTLGVTGITTLAETKIVSEEGLVVEGPTTLEDLSAIALTASGPGTFLDGLSVSSGDTILGGSLNVDGGLEVTGDSALSNTAINTAESGFLTVTGNGNVNFGTTTVNASGDVNLTGNTTISNLILTGDSGFSGNIDMGNNHILNVNTVTRDNVRIFFDNTNRQIVSQTWSGTGWSTAQAITHLSMSINRALSVNNSLTVNGNTTLLGQLASVGNVTTATPLTVFGTTDLKLDTTIGGNLSMSNNHILDVSTVSQQEVRTAYDSNAKTITDSVFDGDTSQWSPVAEVNASAFRVFKDLQVDGNTTLQGNLSVTGLDTTLGNATTTTNLTVWGNVDIKGTATNTRIESSVVQIGDKNIELGFLEVDTLANLHGAGVTVGGPGGSIEERPHFIYDSDLHAWTPNVDIVVKSGSGPDVATLDTAGYLMSANAANSSVFTKIDSTSMNFGDKWRFKYYHTAEDDHEADTIELQHYESTQWVTKFVYAA
jgi:hypothetical protein